MRCHSLVSRGATMQAIVMDLSTWRDLDDNINRSNFGADRLLRFDLREYKDEG